ncbi:50S ribosomal protein L35 [Candidatus Acetothermia bacterium]|jgi:large subunit ribosomal protein L35|nr:50S ribosomal protein L35 [Candidatus Acetothermia bacterium]MCI2431268.1 50S ribosomal protein L35 [Candidatus Acetothermia bacterium]MCI2436275.1 50S ribosomal protein L35 [Candidatus Acetothermia bacterium]
MTKKKTHKGIAKRFKVTRHKKVLGAKSGYHHKLVKRSSSRKRQARRGLQVPAALAKIYVKLL